jgi:hypothetical protein
MTAGPLVRYVVMLTALAVFCGGCGTMQHERVDGGASKREHYRMRSDRPIRVKMGRVDTSRAKLSTDLRGAVGRYLVDQGQAVLGRHDLFEVVGAKAAESDLLSQFMETDAPQTGSVDIDGELELVVREVKERKGATVKVGFVSKQSKKAIVSVTATLRLQNGETYSSKAKGQSTKGAFGVVAMVQRDAMKKKGGVWDLDGSGIGLAASRALDECVSDIAADLHRDVRKLKRDMIERMLRPRPSGARR